MCIFLQVFLFPKYLLILLMPHWHQCATYLSYLVNMATMVPPPPVQNHAKTWWVLGVHLRKNYRQKAEVVSVHHFVTTAMKKMKYSLQKLTLSPRARWSAFCRIKVNKIKEQIVSRKQNCIAVLQRSRSFAWLTAITLTYKSQAAGSWQVGRIKVSVFLYFLVVLVTSIIAGRHLVTCEWLVR